MPEKVIMPKSESLYEAMRIATTPEAAAYLAEKFAKLAEASRMGSVTKPIIDSLRNFARTVFEKSTLAFNIWNGDDRIAKINTAQEVHEINNLASSFEGAQKGRVQEILFGFAVNDKSELKTGYSSGGEDCDKDKKHKLDELWHQWILDNGMAAGINGTIYEAVTSIKEEGNQQKVIFVDFKKDNQGNPIKVPSEKIAQAILDTKNGFKQFVEEKSLIFKINTKQYAFPKDEAPKEQTLSRGAAPAA